MCGIAGFSGSFDRSLLAKMNIIQTHRGPDDAGEWFDPVGGIGMAQRRLSIIDLSDSGHQPMWDATGTVVIIFNGEIYNYRELRETLCKADFVFNSHSDTEVLLNLYLHKGVEMLQLLNGIFAFAIWDTRSREIFVARDGVGVKPFYYADCPEGFVFASELKALLQVPSIGREIDSKAVQYYLTYLWCPAPYTILRKVKKLEPGYAAIVKNGRIARKWQFYDLPYHQAIESITAGEAIFNVEKTLRQAVERQMVSDVPVGAFLSGGLDSSSVAAFAQHSLADKKLQCFTIGFDDNKSTVCEGIIDDLPYAQKVAQHIGVDLHTIYVGSDMINSLEKMIFHLDEPQADPAPINAFYICQLAREHGIKVLLSGAGGDDIFTGYRRHLALMQTKYWDWLPISLKSLIASAARKIPMNTTTGRRVSKVLQYADLTGNEILASYFYWIYPPYLNPLYGEMLRDELTAFSPAQPLLSSLSNLPVDTHPLNKMLYLEAKHFLCDHNLNYTDKMGMATGVEVRVPLLDPDLIDLTARLPVEYKQNGRVGKWIFKKAMEPYLPKEVIYRPKTGFGAPLRTWLKHQLRPVLDDVLSDSSLKNRGLFDSAGVKQLMERDRKGKVDAAYSIFSLLCIELWCRIFIDK